VTFHTITLFSLVKAIKYLSKGSQINPRARPFGTISYWGDPLSPIFLIKTLDPLL
jgi:hypothetical protein